MPSRCRRINRATSFIGSTLEHTTPVHHRRNILESTWSPKATVPSRCMGFLLPASGSAQAPSSEKTHLSARGLLRWLSNHRSPGITEPRSFMADLSSTRLATVDGRRYISTAWMINMAPCLASLDRPRPCCGRGASIGLDSFNPVLLRSQYCTSNACRIRPIGLESLVVIASKSSTIVKSDNSIDK